MGRASKKTLSRPMQKPFFFPCRDFTPGALIVCMRMAVHVVRSGAPVSLEECLYLGLIGLAAFNRTIN